MLARALLPSHAREPRDCDVVLPLQQSDRLSETRMHHTTCLRLLRYPRALP